MKPLIHIYPLLFSLFLLMPAHSFACSVLYYQDSTTGYIYVANHEDYFYDVKAYLQYVPAKGEVMARLWYGWDDFAQGGVNEAGLFFDGAVTPKQPLLEGYHEINSNLGDELLARCQTVKEALDYLETRKIALTEAHMMIGDREGNAVVVEWLDGQRKLHWRTEPQLVMTNFLLEEPDRGNYPCPRYAAIQAHIQALKTEQKPINLLSIGNTLGPAAQIPRQIPNGKTVGTLYSTFINLTDMEFVLVYQLDNQRITKLDLTTLFAEKKRRKIKFG